MGEAAEKLALHRLVDELPESEITHAQRYLEYLKDRSYDPVIELHRNAPIDDEPLTPEEEAAIDEGLADYERGDLISFEEIKRELLS